MRVVIDCANGAAYKVAPEALWELGAEVIKIGVDPNGLNINHEVGSTAPEALARKVREMRADVGIALDGDADRMIIVDEKGHIVDGDQAMAVIAESWRDDGRLVEAGHRRHRHVQSRPRALSQRPRPDARAHRGRRPLRDRADAREGLQCRRRAVGPHHLLRLLHDGRRPCLGAAGSGGGAQARPSRSARSATASTPLPQVLRNVRFNGGMPLENPTVAKAIADATARLGDAAGWSSARPGPSRSSASWAKPTTRRSSTCRSATSATRSRTPRRESAQ